MWAGNYGITETADLVSYLYDHQREALPRKALVVAVTTPINDVGGCIIGYQNELPEKIVPYARVNSSHSRTSYLAVKSFFPATVERSLSYTLDFKNLFRYIKRPEFSVVGSSTVSGDLAIDMNGFSIGCKGSESRKLKLSEETDFSKPKYLCEMSMKLPP